MKQKRLLSVAGFALAAVIGLSGCSLGGEEEKPSASSSEGGILDPTDPGAGSGNPTTKPEPTPTESSTDPEPEPSIDINPSAEPTPDPTKPTNPGESTTPTNPAPTPSNPTNPTAPPTNPTSPPSENPGTKLGYGDGTVLYLTVSVKTNIYAQANLDSQVIGTAASTAKFKGTVTGNGYWLKIDRSPGYIPANAVTVSDVISE